MTGWQKMDLVLPNTAAAEGQRIEPLSAPFSAPGSFSAGQIIPPFEPQQGGQSEFAKRMQRLTESSKPEPQQPKKRLAPQSRLYSKVVEINPRGNEESEPQMDEPSASARPASLNKPEASTAEPSPIQPSRKPRQTPVFPQAHSIETHSEPPQEAARASLPAPAQTDKVPEKTIAHSAPSIIQRLPDPVRQEPASLPVKEIITDQDEARHASTETPHELPLRKKPAAQTHFKLTPARNEKPPFKTLSKNVRPFAAKQSKTEPHQPGELKAPREKTEGRISFSDTSPKAGEYQPPVSRAIAERPAQQEKTELPAAQIPLIRKAGFKPAKRLITRTPVHSITKLPLNIIRRQPQQQLIQRAAPAPQDMAVKKPAAPETSLPQNSAPFVEPRTVSTPVKRAPAAPATHAKQTGDHIRRQAFAQVVQRQAAPSAPRLGAPLQMAIRRKAARPVSRLTAAALIPAPLETHSPAVPLPSGDSEKQPVKLEPLPQPFAHSPLQVIPPMRTPLQLLPPAKKPAVQRKLIHQPAVVRQARTLSRIIQRRAADRHSMRLQPARKENRADQTVSAVPALPAATLQRPPTVFTPGGSAEPERMRFMSSGNFSGETGLRKDPHEENYLPVVRRTIQPAPGNVIRRNATNAAGYYVTDDSDPAAETNSIDSTRRNINQSHSPANSFRSPQGQNHETQSQPSAGSNYFTAHRPNQAEGQTRSNYLASHRQSHQPQEQTASANNYYAPQSPAPSQSREEEQKPPAPPQNVPYELPSSWSSDVPPQAQPEVYEMPRREEQKLSADRQSEKPTSPETNLQQLARDVLPLIKKMIAIEKERSSIR